MSGHKVRHHILVFPVQHGTGGIHQRAAGTDIPAQIGQQRRLDCGQSLGFIQIFVTNVRLFADDAETRTGHIRHHQVKGFHQFRLEVPAVRRGGVDALQAQPFGSGLNAPQLILVQIPGQNIP